MTDFKVFLDNVLNLWIPDAVVAVEIPIVLIPASASSLELCNWTVLELIILTLYGAPVANVPVAVLLLSLNGPMPNSEFPLLL